MQVLPRFILAAGDGNVALLRDTVQKHGLGHVDAASPAGETALMAACRAGHGSAVRFLVEVCSARVDTRFPGRGDGWTALMYAGYFGRVGIVRYLVEQGADFTLRNSDNLTVLEVAPCANATLSDVQEAVALGIQLRADVTEEAVTVSYSQIAADSSTLAASSSGTQQQQQQQQRFGPDSRSAAATAAALSSSSSSANAGGSVGGIGEDALASWRQRNAAAANAATGATDIATARPRLVALYLSACSDFGVAAEQGIVAAINDNSGDIPESGLGALALGRWQKALAKWGDTALTPLLEVLAHAFPSYPLHSLDLSYTGLGDAAARPLGLFIAASRTLVAVNLEGNLLGPRAGALLAAAMATQPSVQHLNLSWNPLEDAGVCALADSLANSNGTLLALELGNTHMGVLAVIKLSNLLRARQPPLSRLNLDSPQLLSPEGEEAVAAVARALPGAAVASLSLAKAACTDSGARMLADGLALNASLSELNLRCNRITATGAAALARALKGRNAACFVNLDANLLRDQALDEVYEVLDAPSQAGSGKVGSVNSGCEVQFITDEPLDEDEVDRFQTQRHCLVSRPFASPE